MGTDNRGRVRRRVGLCLQVVKPLFHQVQNLIVAKVSRRGDDHIIRPIGTRKLFLDRFPVQRPHRLGSAQDRLAQRMSFPEVPDEQFVEQIFRIVLFGLDLLQHHLPLPHHILGFEQRIEHEVAQHVKGLGQVFVQNHSVEADAFFGREGVQMSADGIHGPGNLLRRAIAGPFENHVFDEVRNPASGGVFLPGTGSQPDPQGDRPHLHHGFGENDQSVRQTLLPNVAHFFSSHPPLS